MAINLMWKDRKRILGMPISFTRYSLSDDRVFIKKGLLTTTQSEAMLYRIKDIKLSQTLSQKLFRVGTITLYTVDTDTPVIEIKNIKKHEDIKETIHEYVEKQKKEKNMTFNEFA